MSRNRMRPLRTSFLVCWFGLLALALSCCAWVNPLTSSLSLPKSRHHSHPSTTTTSLGIGATGGVQTIDLGDSNLSDNHEEEGQLLAESIQKWLDFEWYPQEVHLKMGESAKASYIRCREAGKSDLMDVMMEISTDLDVNWAEYDKDAFVNAWEIGNYSADYLTKKSGNEGCECSSEIF